ncbi:MAG TPA: VWA domain-containing protein [Fimbriimonadaceae bacterium]|jgi:uncharacterized membrane protein
MRFSDPLYLLLLIPFFIALALSYPRVHGMLKARKRLAFFLRFLLIGLLVVALAGPEAFRKNHGLCTIFLLDRSDSIQDKDRSKQEDFIKKSISNLAPDDEVGIVVFGKDATVETMPSTTSNLDRVTSVVDGSATDIAAAVRLASATFPDGKSRRMVLLSDGNETSGEVERAAEVSASENVPIDFVPLGAEIRGEVAINELQVPSDSRSGRPFQVKVSVSSDIATEGLLSLDRDGLEVKKSQVTLSPGENTFAFDQAVDTVGFHRYRATIEAQGDHDTRNNVGVGFVVVRGKPKVLILQSKPQSSPLAAALRQQNIDTVVSGPYGAPTHAEDLQAYDAVLYNDVAAEPITPDQMKLMKSAVRDTGIGFGMIGGEDSFLPGGWFGTPVADTLPVDLEVKKRVSFPSTSVLIICDTSGSMGMVEDGVMKVKLAAKAAAFTVQMMSSQDRAGVVASTDAIEFVAPMQKLSNKAQMVHDIMRMDVGGGGIYAKPSMDFAIAHLELEQSKVRHLILMADGSDVDLRDGCFEVAARMRVEHITTSCVAIGDGQYVPFLKQLAAVGGGRFYLALHGNQLPAVFTQDAAMVARSAIEEGAFLPKVSMGEEILKGIDSSTIPPLLAYDLTDFKPLARTGMKTAKDDPLLAVWQYGLGTTLAFTSDAQARWAAKWVPWDGFGTFWAQAVREISRRAASNQYQLETKLEGAKAVVSLKASDANGNPVNNLPARVIVSAPDGSSADMSLTQSAPGQYSGNFTAGQIGSYIVSIAETDASGTKRVSASGFSIPYPLEYRSFRTNLPLLKTVAKTTGGKGLTSPAEAFRGVPQPGYSIQDLWAVCLLLAALLLPLDIASRRIALPIAEMYAKVVGWLRHRRHVQRAAPAAEAVGRLHQAKQRANTSSSGEPVRPVSVGSQSVKRPSEPREPAVPAPGTMTNKLLDAKRKRKEGE